MFSSVLVVCVGNICRSPAGERLLRAKLPGMRIESAGLAAMVGEPASRTMVEVAAEHGISLDGHVSRQFTAALGGDFDLILTMEAGHRREIASNFPHLTGKTLLFGKWLPATDIPDPYRLSRSFYEAVYTQIEASSEEWARRLRRSA